MKSYNKNIILFFSLFLLVLMYLVSAFNKITSFNSTVKDLSKKIIFNMFPLFFTQLSLMIVILLEVICSLIIIMAIFDRKLKNKAIISAILLGIYTFLATLLYHFPPKGIQYYMFFKNISIIGAFMLLTVLFSILP